MKVNIISLKMTEAVTDETPAYVVLKIWTEGLIPHDVLRIADGRKRAPERKEADPS